MSSSRCTASAPPTQRSLSLDAAALLLHAARTTFGAQPQLPPGFFPHPATPPFQFGRIGRDRRSGPDSAAEISPGRHFVSRDGSGAARERGRPHEITRRRRFPGVQGSQGSSRRRPQLGTSQSIFARRENCFRCQPDEEGEEGRKAEGNGDGGELERDEGTRRREDAGPEPEEPGMRRREDAGLSRRQRKSPTSQNLRTEEDSYSRQPGEPKEEVSRPDSHAMLLDERR
ncbi:hypothetical protein NDU88_005212 [Pleurodeles waltl]|uniref:Uncharacterized protein n=1 Tax=Pleurodeles waltl TaxID=8319 RepID=A0AAV7L374_PLEWA|nr:hypothetical protein NDU88_005212 [Pleurodeles waltl]